MWALVLIALVAVLGYRSIDLGAKVLGVLLVLEIGIILALSFGVLVRGGPRVSTSRRLPRRRSSADPPVSH